MKNKLNKTHTIAIGSMVFGIIIGSLGLVQSTMATVNSVLTEVNGNIGLGTLNPESKLDVNGSTIIGSLNTRESLKIKSASWPELTFQTPTDDNIMRLGVAHATDARYKVKSGDLYIYSANQNKMGLVIPKTGGVLLAPDGGNVGIGTDTPTATLDVKGDIKTQKLCLNGTCISSWDEILNPESGTEYNVFISVDNDDSETNSPKNIMGDVTSDFVASYELNSINERTLIKDLEIIATEQKIGDFISSVSQVILYENDKVTEIARTNVTSTTVAFNNINYVVNNGSENIYVKLVTNKIGYQSIGAQTSDISLAMYLTNLEGTDSGKTITPVHSDQSLGFKVVPVKIIDINFVSSYAGNTVASRLINGENIVGIIGITTDSNFNRNSTNNDFLQTEIESLVVELNTNAAEFDNDGTAGTAVEAGSITSLTIEKINGFSGPTSISNTDGSNITSDDKVSNTNFDLFKGVNLGNRDKEMGNGETTYYLVKATFYGLSEVNNKFIQLKLNNLDGGSTIEYSSTNLDDTDAQNAFGTDEATDDITSLRIGTSSISSNYISSDY